MPCMSENSSTMSVTRSALLSRAARCASFDGCADRRGQCGRQPDHRVGLVLQGAQLLLEDDTVQRVDPVCQWVLLVGFEEEGRVGQARPDNSFVAGDNLCGVGALYIGRR